MANITDIERLNYYEGEFLGAVDFEAEQEYHRDMRRRHNLGQHTWGIVAGLDLAQVPNGNPNGEVDIYLMPGMAVDGFGREIVVLAKSQLTPALFAAFFSPSPRIMNVWIGYDQLLQQPSGDACAAANQPDAFSRTQETYRIVINPAQPANDPVVVDGAALVPPVPQPSPPTAAPGVEVLPFDDSVPYQEFPSDDTAATWFVPLGQVQWDAANQRFLPIAGGVADLGRIYAGSVGATAYAPAGTFTIQDRDTPSPLADFPAYNGVAVEIEGSLQVDRLLNAAQQALIGAVQDPAAPPLTTPLTIVASGTGEELVEFRNPSQQPTWHIGENLNGNTPGLNIGEITPKGAHNEFRLFIQPTITTPAPSDQNVGVGTAGPRNPVGIRSRGAWEELLSFEDPSGSTNWHINQNPQGKDPQGNPFVRGLNFSETGAADFRLFLAEGGNVGVGTPLPQQNLSVNGSLNIDQGNRNDGQFNPGLTFGSTSGEGIASKRSPSGNQFGLDFYTDFATRMSITNGGNVGLGVTAPNAQLQISGGQWNLTSTEGDLKIGNDAMRLKFGIALAGASAGDARIRAMGGTSRLMIGSGVDDTLTVVNGKVGIETITPGATLDVVGDIRASGGISANSLSTGGGMTVSGNLFVQGDVTVNGRLNAPTKNGCVADRFLYREGRPLERGDVVVVGSHSATHSYGPDGSIPLVEVELGAEPRDPRVCGIVHTPELGDEENPGIDSGALGGAKIGLMVTLGAYAYCKVDAGPAPIAAGDLLTTSSTPGYAQKLKGSSRAGIVIAKALGTLERNRGIIPVLVSHQ